MQDLDMTGWMAQTGVVAAGLGFGTLVGGIAGGWLIAGGLLAWRRLMGIGGAALMGLGVSLYLGRQHHPNHAPSACNVDDLFNCDIVNTSQYSEVAGLPIALIGAAFYAGVLFLVAMASRSKESYSRAAHLITAGGVMSVLYSLFLAWASIQVGAWCLFCISLYGVNALILGGGLWAVKESGVPLGSGVGEALTGKADRSLGSMATAGVVTLVVSLFWYNGLGDASVAVTSDGPVDVSSLVERVADGADMDGTEPVYGSPQAAYTVLEWADFECPHCGVVAPELKRVVDANPDIKVAFRNYPLSNKCNSNVPSSFHEYACDAAFAAECANKQGKFWELTGLMFKNQGYLDRAGISTMAEQKGLDVAALVACMNDPATELAVKTDIAAGEKAGVTGTPALYLLGAHGPETWVKITASPEQIPDIVAAHKAAGAPLPAPR
jgi:protein-disulfide isomerase/uncharacterized membrane protein